MRFPPIIQAASLVAVGNFNPAIFSPAWLRLNEVISDEQFEEAKVSIIHPEVAEINVDTLAFQVTPQKMMIKTTEMPFVVIADIMTMIFGALLPHTPIQRVGINLELHFSLESSSRKTALGRALAPIAPWGEWGKRLESKDLDRIGGLRTLALEQWDFPERIKGSYRRVQIEPSLIPTANQKTDVFMLVNDNFEIEEGSGASPFVKVVQENFDLSMGNSVKIVADIMDFAARIA